MAAGASLLYGPVLATAIALPRAQGGGTGVPTRSRRIAGVGTPRSGVLGFQVWGRAGWVTASEPPAFAPGRIASVEDQGVAVEVSERREVTDPGVRRFRDELDPLRFEFGSRRGDVGHSQCKSGLVCNERQSLAFWLPEAERHVRRLNLVPVASLSGSPKTSRYQAIARAALRVGIEMKSTSSTCTAT